MLDATGHQSYITDGNVPDVTGILFPLEIPARKVVKIILMLIPSSLCSMTFPSCLIASIN